MNTSAIRKKLVEYIQVADDRKVKAIYTMVEHDLTQTEDWWNDKDLLAELDARSEALKKGADKGILWETARKNLLNQHQ
jgi:hypothetical protein